MSTTDARKSLYDRQENDNDDDEDKDVFGQIIQIRIPRRNAPNIRELTAPEHLDTTTNDSFSLPSKPHGWLPWKPWVS